MIIGLHDVPNAGDIMEVVGDERTARAIAEKRSEEAKQQELSRPSRPLSLDEFSSAIRAGQAQELSVVLKTDVQGSIEPIVNSITRLSTDNIKVNVIHAAAGNISESDMNLALASDAIVLGFRVSADAAALRMADMEGMEIHIYEIIYRLVDDVEKALKGMLEPTYTEVTIGEADVRQIFDISSLGKIAGCYVTQGVARRNAKVRVLRNDSVLYDGAIDSLKRFTEDVREVRQNFECGVKVQGFDDLSVGDRLQFYTMRRVEQE